MSDDGYTPIRTIEQFAARAASASGKSAAASSWSSGRSFRGQRPAAGGRAGPAGPTTFIGAVGAPTTSRVLHPLYGELERRASWSFPSRAARPHRRSGVRRRQADAGPAPKYPERDVGLAELHARARPAPGHLRERLADWHRQLGDDAGVSRDLAGPCTDVFGRVKNDGRPRRVFIDLSDPAKRTDPDIRRALGLLTEMNRPCP